MYGRYLVLDFLEYTLIKNIDRIKDIIPERELIISFLNKS